MVMGHRGKQSTGRMGPRRPPALRGCARGTPPNLLHILHDRALGLHWGPSASGQDPDPHSKRHRCGWAGMGDSRGRGEAGFRTVQGELALAPTGHLTEER